MPKERLALLERNKSGAKNRGEDRLTIGSAGDHREAASVQLRSLRCLPLPGGGDGDPSSPRDGSLEPRSRSLRQDASSPQQGCKHREAEGPQAHRIRQDASPIGWDVDDPTVVAKSIVALLSDWLPGTTGSIIYVDGGASHNTWFPENFQAN